MKIVIISAMWCPGCIVMHKVWKNIKEKYSNIEYLDYDYDVDCDTVESFNPGDVLPVMIIFNDEQEVCRMIGEKSEQEIIEEIEKYM